MTAALVGIVVAIVGALIVLPQTFFTVDETQLAIVTEFGKFKEDYTSPGLYVKQPFTQQVTRFDKRLLRVDAPSASVLTADKRNLVIDAYARYKITDPLLFFQSLRDERGAEARVGDIVASELRREVALDQQDDVIGPNREEIMRRITYASNSLEIERHVAMALPGKLRDATLSISITTDALQSSARGRRPTEQELMALESEPAPAVLGQNKVTYLVPLSKRQGIEIVDVRIQAADFPPDIASSIYARMKAERERIASGLRAEGSQRDAEIRAEVDRDVSITVQNAEGTSARLRGEAERAAIVILDSALSQDPEFYAFRRSLEAYKIALKTDTTVVLDANSELFKYLQGPSPAK
ncbi:MAG: protease modulator HflC [Dehalococcoidia bacterium]|nr:protease modulator HflC [Dehalococcoidia bacterium]MSQ34427.1 protease modulator HflC [Dehalococcoidia bacterium]